MITKEQIRKQGEDINKKLDSVMTTIEGIFEWATKKGCPLASETDKRLIYSVLAHLSMDVDFLLEDIYDVLDENEQIHALPVLIKYRNTFDQIRSVIGHFDERP